MKLNTYIFKDKYFLTDEAGNKFAYSYLGELRWSHMPKKSGACFSPGQCDDFKERLKRHALKKITEIQQEIDEYIAAAQLRGRQGINDYYVQRDESRIKRYQADADTKFRIVKVTVELV